MLAFIPQRVKRQAQPLMAASPRFRCLYLLLLPWFALNIDAATNADLDSPSGSSAINHDRESAHQASHHGNVDIQQIRSQYTQYECPFTSEHPIICARMRVKESRDLIESRWIEFPILVLKSPTPTTKPPVILLGGGGPGAAVGINGAWQDFWWENFKPIALDHGHDVIIMEQRGVGKAKPALNCEEMRQLMPSVISQPLSSQQETKLFAEAARQCQQRLQNIANLGAYSSISSAHDVEELRLALGIDKWILYGVSYGGRLALTIMRYFPQSVHAAILDSIEPPHIQFYEEGPYSVNRAFEAVFANCQSDRVCAQSFPKIDQQFNQLLKKLARQPLEITLQHPESETSIKAVINARRIVEMFFFGLYDLSTIELLPAMIHDLNHQGESRSFNQLAQSYLSESMNRSWSHGLYYSVQCHEELPFNNLRQSLSASHQYPNYHGFHSAWVDIEKTICGFWQSGQAEEIENQPVKSDIPALLLTGEYDPVTPPKWSQDTAGYLKNHQYKYYVNATHDVGYSKPCSQRVISQFIQSPLTIVDDQACENEPDSFRFKAK